jgi:aryl-alcohol dehydrogenase-like predicted oxidoreductase
MLQHQIATTGCNVSVFGLGTVKFGRNTNVKYPKSFVLPDDKTVANLLAIAKHHGVNLLDTAPAYGSSEERLGALLKSQRQDWVVSTKVGESWSDKGSQFDFTGAAVEQSITSSLQRLATDYLDIVLVHSDGRDETIIRELDTLATLENLKSKGLIRCIGMSTKTVAGGMLAIERCDLAMVTYNLTRKSEQPVLDHATKLNKGIFIKKALDSGNKPAHLDSKVWLQDSLRFVLDHPAVTSIIMGTINPQHLLDNLETIIQLQQGKLAT